MAMDLFDDGRNQTLEQYLRSRVSRAMTEKLEKAELFVALAPETNALLQKTAEAHQANESRIIALIIETSGDLLQDTLPAALRDRIRAVRSIERQPSPPRETDTHAGDLLARLIVRGDRRLPVDPPRRHFSISRESKRLLGTVAGYHSLDMTRIVETLIILGLSDPVSNRNEM
jgi:hypothetical protein